MSDNKQDMPYLTEDGTLVIPFSCPDHAYKYWKKEGKQLSEVLEELNTDKKTWYKFTTDKHPEDRPAKEDSEDGEGEE